MDDKLAGEAAKLASQAQELATNLKAVAQQVTDMLAQGTAGGPDGHMPFVSLLPIFPLARFVGYYVGWRGAPRASRASAPPSCSAPSPWRSPPSTSLAASSSRTACCRCSRRRLRSR